MCRWHGGAAPQVARKAAERAALAEIVAQLPALEQVDPSIGLAEALALTSQAVTHFRAKVVAAGADPVAATGAYDALGQWIDRLQRVSKAGHDAGVADRRVRVEEAQVQLLAGAVRAIVARLGLDPTDPKVVRVIEHELRALDVVS